MSGTSDDRRQVSKKVCDLLTVGQTQAEFRVATPEEDRQYKDMEPTLYPVLCIAVVLYQLSQDILLE